MDGNGWIVGETLKARRKAFAALYQDYWYPPLAKTARARVSLHAHRPCAADGACTCITPAAVCC